MSHHDMPSNSHYENARHWDNKPMTDGQVRLLQAQATLALAYEQRTANLIAMQALGITDMTDWPATHVAAWSERAIDITTRLGGAR